MHLYQKNKKAFTLIELLVVISIVSLISSVALASLNSARAKARDVQRKQQLAQLQRAIELYYNTNGSYPGTDGWVDGPGSLNAALVPAYITSVPTSGVAPNGMHQYWRKDYTNPSYPCMTLSNGNKFALYASLERPSAADIATVTGGDSFDQCVGATWTGMNFKLGN